MTNYKPETQSAWLVFKPVSPGGQLTKCPECQAETLVTHIHRRDWEQIIRALMAAGLSLDEIGRRIQRADTTVLHWINGGEPKESDARKILVLYRKHVEGGHG